MNFWAFADKNPGWTPVGATIFGCNTASGTCVVSGLVTLKGLPFPLAQATNQVAGMCKPRSYRRTEDSPSWRFGVTAGRVRRTTGKGV